MSNVDELAEALVAYMGTRRTPFDTWEDAATEAVRLCVTEARVDTLRAMGVPESRIVPWHTLRIEPTSWHLTHPIFCDLSDCPFDAVAQRWDSPPGPVGEYRWDQAHPVAWDNPDHYHYTARGVVEDNDPRPSEDIIAELRGRSR